MMDKRTYGILALILVLVVVSIIGMLLFTMPQSGGTLAGITLPWINPTDKTEELPTDETEALPQEVQNSSTALEDVGTEGTAPATESEVKSEVKSEEDAESPTESSGVNPGQTSLQRENELPEDFVN